MPEAIKQWLSNCNYKWDDGWGAHVCHLAKDHVERGVDHMCRCDTRERVSHGVQQAAHD